MPLFSGEKSHPAQPSGRFPLPHPRLLSANNCLTGYARRNEKPVLFPGASSAVLFMPTVSCGSGLTWAWLFPWLSWLPLSYSHGKSPSVTVRIPILGSTGREKLDKTSNFCSEIQGFRILHPMELPRGKNCDQEPRLLHLPPPLVTAQEFLEQPPCATHPAGLCKRGMRCSL